MISSTYEQLLERAILIAQTAHAGQVDKAGQPYIEHPLAVMHQVESPDAKIVAVLHDVVEDSEITIAYLAEQGFSEDVIAAIAAITKQDGESYEEYLDRVMSNPLALRVKIADMTHNLDLSRIPNPTAADHKRIEKYKVILPRLKAALEWHLGRNTY